MPTVSHPAAAAPLSLSLVCAEAVPVTFRQPSSSGRRWMASREVTTAQTERERRGRCREVFVTTTAAAQTEEEARPLLNGYRKATGTASVQPETERRDRCWMAAGRQPVLLLHRQRERERPGK